MANKPKARQRGFGVRGEPISTDPVPLLGTGEKLARADVLFARVRLGEMIRNRREELRLKMKEVAGRLRWTTQFYGEVEKGFKSSPDVGAWIRLADILQLDRIRLIQQVWDTRDSLPVLLPPEPDDRRLTLLTIVVDMYAASEPEPI